jgi:hypothetical protein
VYYNTNLIFRRGEVWRLLTNFFFFGSLGLDFVFHMFFLVKYCKSLEEGESCARPRLVGVRGCVLCFEKGRGARQWGGRGGTGVLGPRRLGAGGARRRPLLAVSWRRRARRRKARGRPWRRQPAGVGTDRDGGVRQALLAWRSWRPLAAGAAAARSVCSRRRSSRSSSSSRGGGSSSSKGSSGSSSGSSSSRSSSRRISSDGRGNGSHDCDGGSSSSDRGDACWPAAGAAAVAAARTAARGRRLGCEPSPRSPPPPIPN